ncbi:Chaperonin GroEL (HSP60 family) [Halomicrobium zhouii]|uniref:Chaperonin GroEL (HSP60 family) n=1 Tax=Halomicrobium zhouii TaxID=767519 RepID=A0A1I6KZX1_9EURY|nr:TCP-1/cpn60 chaperonin family protein [Halomicrobium zhouii]SFR96772.1 Chaperonin GroEL (HSP60 family) [Halomicrobium zhouii]
MTTDETYTGWSRVPSRETRAAVRQTSGAMAELVRSTLGPLGLDKMIVRRMPDDELRGFVTNDGIGIIEEFEGETDDPIAQQYITLAEDHEDDVGDGVTTMFLLACDLLSASMDLVDQGVHPNDVVEGYSIAAQRTIENWVEMAVPVAREGELHRDTLETIAMTGMTNGRTQSWPLDQVVDTVVDAVLRVSDPETGTTRLDHADTVAVHGGTVTDTELVEGAVVPREVVDAEYLLPAEGPILLVDGDLTSRELTADVSVSIDPEDPAKTAESFDESAGIAEAIGETGAVAVVVTGDADMQVAYELAGEGAVLVRDTKDSTFEYLQIVTGATPIGPVSPGASIDPDVLGHVRLSRRDMARDTDWLAFEAPPGTGQPAVTIVVRGGTESVAEEAERRIRTGKNALRAVVQDPRALPAGGAPDVAAAVDVRSFARRFDGREQLAVETFADVLETVPKTLAHNAGLDPLAALADLRGRHDAGDDRAGVSADGEVVDDVVAHDGLDAFRVRVSGLVRAVEFVNGLTRVDNFLVDQRVPTVDSVLGEPEYDEPPGNLMAGPDMDD